MLPGTQRPRDSAFRPARRDIYGRRPCHHVERPPVPFAGGAFDGCLRAAKRRSRAIVEACLARIDAHDAHLHAFVDVYRDDALAAADAADRRAPRRDRARSARRAADRAQGPPARRGPGDHRRLEELARPHLRSHGDRRPAPRGRRNDPARQDPHGRIRVRRLGPQPADGRAVESVGRDDAPRRRRLVERLGRRGGRRALPGGDRLGHRRIDPHSRRALRHHRLEAHVRPRQPLRRRAAVRHARLHRPARAHRRGLRAPDRRDGRPPIRTIPRRSLRRAAISKPRCRRARRARRAHHRARAGSVPRVHAARRRPRLSRGDRRAARSGRAGRRSVRSRSTSTT